MTFDLFDIFVASFAGLSIGVLGSFWLIEWQLKKSYALARDMLVSAAISEESDSK